MGSLRIYMYIYIIAKCKRKKLKGFEWLIILEGLLRWKFNFYNDYSIIHGTLTSSRQWDWKHLQWRLISRVSFGEQVKVEDDWGMKWEISRTLCKEICFNPLLSIFTVTKIKQSHKVDSGVCEGSPFYAKARQGIRTSRFLQNTQQIK